MGNNTCTLPKQRHNLEHNVYRLGSALSRIYLADTALSSLLLGGYTTGLPFLGLQEGENGHWAEVG